MNFNLAVIFSFSIAIAAIIGWIRFKKINPAYYPFLYCIWLAFLSEIISYLVVRGGHSNAINSNIYMLGEALLIPWQFKNWGLFQRPKYLFPGLLILFTLLWTLESFFIKGITLNISYFKILYSFAIVLMSIQVINNQLMRERRNFLRSPIFLITAAFVFYYINAVIVGVFWLYGLQMSMRFMLKLAWILIYVNLFTNLIYALAVLWMPTKHRFSLPS